ncbi:hypothetical protein ACRALDRAFT_1082612 [Sodiomyces alcalophilus JCM 7366]|uniref:uncharacterized protein n=1 Tax=Sodiomyces alcalophilus JCM 7366 TaxID=591952 RepID=UPI0039B43FB5
MARLGRRKAASKKRTGKAKRAPQRREPRPPRKVKQKDPLPPKDPPKETTPAPEPAPKPDPVPVSEPEPNACNHKSFPKESTSSNSEKPVFELEIQSYSASLLLRQTVEEYRCSAVVRDIHAEVKRRFVKLYTDYIDPTAPIDDQILHAARLPLHAKEKFLREMMDLLDESFFFGTMTKVYGGRESPLVSLDLHPGSASSPTLGKTAVWDAWHPSPEITIYNKVQWPHSYTTSFVLAGMVETLLHEMVHAYLMLFVCKSDKCERNILNTVGLTGHSHTWKALHAVIVREIRSWDPAVLGGFRADQCIPEKEYCITSCEQEEWAQMEQRDVSAARGLRPSVKPARTRVVRFSQTGRVVVKLGPRAKKRQAWLKSRETRKRRMRRKALEGKWRGGREDEGGEGGEDEGEDEGEEEAEE